MASGHHVRLKYVEGRLPSPRNKVQEEDRLMTTLDETALSIRAKQAYELPDGLKITVHREEDVDKILSEKCKTKLLTIGLVPFCPPEKMANQTVVVRTKSSLIHAATEEQLRADILKQHPKVKIVSIWKDEQMGIIKIQCLNTDQAKNLRSKDLKLKGYTMGPEDLETGEFIPISQCLRCYRLDSHASSQCRDTKMYCGNCAAIDDHRHADCLQATPDCINCIRSKKAPEDRRHNARSNTCPCKKKILKKKRRELRDPSRNPEQRQPVEFVDAPPPQSNAWNKKGNANARSISRGRGKQRGGNTTRKDSYNRRSYSRHSNTRNKPNKPPAVSDQSYPDLARNGKERKENKKKKNNNPTIPMEHANSASAQVHAGTVDMSYVQEERTMEYSDLENLLTRAGMDPPGAPHRRETFTEARRIIEAEIPRTAPITRPCSINEINIILTASHHHNLTRPGEFNKRANYLFKRANLPAVDLGDDWHSADFLAAISNFRGNNPVGTCNCNCKSQETSNQHQISPSPVNQSTQLLAHPPQQTPMIDLTSQAHQDEQAASLVANEEDMDAQSMGVKRRRNTSSPVEPETKRNRESSIQSPEDPDDPEPVENLFDLNGTITGTLDEQLVQAAQQVEAAVDNPLSPADTENFEDAETTIISADVSVVSAPAGTGTEHSQTDDSLPELPQPEKEIPVMKKPAKKNPELEMPPPKNLPVLTHQPQRSPVRRRRSSSTDDRMAPSPIKSRDPRLNRRDCPSPKGHTPLKRTTSTLALPKTLPPPPSFSQLDRAMEEALEEDKRNKATKLQRKESVERKSKPGTPVSSPRGLSKLEHLQNIMAADEIARNRIHITTANKKLLDQISDATHPLSVPALIGLWKQGQIVLEVKPRTASPDGVEPPWRVRKYATLTRTVYEDRIDPKEWE